MINKYGLYVLSGLSLLFSVYGTYLKVNHFENGNLFLIISVFITTIFLLYLLAYIKKLRKNQQENK